MKREDKRGLHINLGKGKNLEEKSYSTARETTEYVFFCMIEETTNILKSEIF